MAHDSSLSQCRILIVEDEYMLAIELRAALVEVGAVILGPAGSIADALALISAEPHIDVAVLDMNLQGEMVFPVADRLLLQEVPFVFTTGYDLSTIPSRFKHIVRYHKPISMSAVRVAIGQIVGSRN